MKFIIIIFTFLCFASCKTEKSKEKSTTETASEIVPEVKKDSLIFSEEKHFKSIKQITFGGDNAEAYWSFDDNN